MFRLENLLRKLLVFFVVDNLSMITFQKKKKFFTTKMPLCHYDIVIELKLSRPIMRI